MHQNNNMQQDLEQVDTVYFLHQFSIHLDIALQPDKPPLPTSVHSSDPQLIQNTCLNKRKLKYYLVVLNKSATHDRDFHTPSDRRRLPVLSPLHPSTPSTDYKPAPPPNSDS